MEYDETANIAYIGERKDNLSNNSEKTFVGKYDPKDYKTIFSNLQINDQIYSIVLIDNKYYVDERECRKLLERNNILDEDIYDESTMKNTYVINGDTKIFDIVMYEYGGYILFDEFVDEILPYVQ